MLVSEAINRTRAEYLFSGGNTPDFDTLNTTINSSVTQLVTNGLQTYLSAGTVIEIDSEAMLTKETETSTTIDIAERGHRGTTAASHTAGAIIWIDPPFFRDTIFDAIVSVVSSLYGMGLYKVTRTEALTPNVTSPIALPTGAREVLGVRGRTGSLQWSRPLQRYQDYDVISETSPAELQLYTYYPTIAVSYKSDFTLPDTEARDLNTYCGVPASLEPFIPMAVAAQLLTGTEVPEVVANDIRSKLANEGIPIGSRLTVGQQLQQGWERAVARERVRLREMHPMRIETMR